MYWLLINEEPLAPVDEEIFTGVLPADLPRLVSCPNCRTNMYPVFSISKNKMPIQIPDQFFINGLFTLDVCPRCTHSLLPYAVRFGASRVASGGYISDGSVSNSIDEPYACRAVSVEPVSQEIIKKFQNEILKRKYPPYVYHQLGGEPLRKDQEAVGCNCEDCGSRLQFIAAIDYDEMNIPLYQNGDPFCLIIGDLQLLNVWLCSTCSKLIYSITE